MASNCASPYALLLSSDIIDDKLLSVLFESVPFIVERYYAISVIVLHFLMPFIPINSQVFFMVPELKLSQFFTIFVFHSF